MSSVYTRSGMASLRSCSLTMRLTSGALERYGTFLLHDRRIGQLRKPAVERMQRYSGVTSVRERDSICEIDAARRKNLQRSAKLIAALDLVARMVQQLSRDAHNLLTGSSIALVQHPKGFDKHDARDTHLAGPRNQRTSCRALIWICRIIYERTQ